MRGLLVAMALLLSTPSLAAEGPEQLERYRAQYQTAQTVGWAGLVGGAVGFATSIGAGLAPAGSDGAPQLGFAALNLSGSVAFSAGPIVGGVMGLRGAALLEKLGSPNVRKLAGQNALILGGSALGLQVAGGIFAGIGLAQLAAEHPEILDDPDTIQDIDPAEIPLLLPIGALMALASFPLYIASYVAAATQLSRNRQAQQVDRRPIGASAPAQRLRLLGISPIIQRDRATLSLSGTF